MDEAAVQQADIRAGIDSALELLKGQIDECVTVVKDYGEVPEITCYPGELNQVFLALVTNAFEAIEGSGAIHIDVRADDSTITVRITDTGRGIPKEQLDKLFDFAFSSSQSRVKLRTSLVTAHKIIQEHRGEILVQSEIGKGSTFTVRLPIDTRLTED